MLLFVQLFEFVLVLVQFVLVVLALLSLSFQFDLALIAVEIVGVLLGHIRLIHRRFLPSLEDLLILLYIDEGKVVFHSIAKRVRFDRSCSLGRVRYGRCEVLCHT